MPLAQAPRLLEPGDQALEDGVLRNPDGTLLIAVRTEMPGVTGEMIDWWFGWHLTSSERYRLWHPRDHVRATVEEDRSYLSDDRERYVGNVSYVDEYIGGRLMKLAIEFVPPTLYGLEPGRFAEARVDTAVCARTAFQGWPLAVGHLIHLVRRVPGGCELRSRFWLGDIEVRLPVLGGPLSRLLNRASLRRRVAPDGLGLGLLVHCAEEMNHLARLLPGLYRAFPRPGP
ncbi:DAPG hydrolase family protein [Archangium lansingense]|uniref:DAPG hydrolase PhiG domain-containing protein n=1 Tax=Archangium lansingense TaxID=2995310 RepID=A0ABT3ZVS8_9BACT|nr:hypothetical protein [Archangium lansinium]MCY1073517.1 hypothetical protein [Archangium lansinium]